MARLFKNQNVSLSKFSFLCRGTEHRVQTTRVQASRMYCRSAEIGDQLQVVDLPYLAHSKSAPGSRINSARTDLFRGTGFEHFQRRFKNARNDSVLLRSLKLNGVSHKAEIEEVKKIRSWHYCTLIALVMVSFLQIAKCYAVK